MNTRFLISIGMMTIVPLIFENAYALNDKLPWYFLVIAYWPVSIIIVGIIVTVIIVIWRKRK